MSTYGTEIYGRGGTYGSLVLNDERSITPTIRSVIGFYGTRRDPQDIIDMRKSSMDFHTTLGQFVVHKHRWNERDVQEGRAKKCPLHDNTYDQDAYDEYCFGTGYLGGFDNGTLVPVTIGDSQEDVFRPNEQGILIHERHPGMTAPWTPDMGDDDLVIVVEVDPITLDIIEMGDRYMLREVTPVTIRGPSFKSTAHMKPYKVNQESMIDLLPYGHPFYNVPINFDYSVVPSPTPDPDVPGYFLSTEEWNIRIVGSEQGPRLSRTQDVRIAVIGGQASASYGIRLTGEGGGTHVHW
jgi:hypothetical protein